MRERVSPAGAPPIIILSLSSPFCFSLKPSPHSSSVDSPLFAISQYLQKKSRSPLPLPSLLPRNQNPYELRAATASFYLSVPSIPSRHKGGGEERNGRNGYRPGSILNFVHDNRCYAMPLLWEDMCGHVASS